MFWIVIHRMWPYYNNGPTFGIQLNVIKKLLLTKFYFKQMRNKQRTFVRRK